jgi:hypothetical protein
MRRAVVVMIAILGMAAVVPAASAKAHRHHKRKKRHHTVTRVLRVGVYHGIKGQYTSIQAAVNAAKPGDWILIAPGDWKTTSSNAPADSSNTPAGVLITTPNIVLRGMNRNTTIVDGTMSGPACNDIDADQNLGPSQDGSNTGLNGIMVYKANNVWVQNLTACNFLGGAAGDGEAGNQIWWNGGADSGQIGGWNYLGSYLNATSTYFDPANDPDQAEVTAAEYGIFSSNWSGGTWNQDYTSNMNDSGFYIGACQQVCNQTLMHAWSEFNALGYSGSNSGGQLVVESSQFDNNEDGFDTNSQNGDNPPPQDGACPGGATSPITHTSSCWVFRGNYVHDNNNPNVPTAGSAAAGPVGTGMSISGGRNDTIEDNIFANNGAWGTIFVPYPDSGPPCTGGTGGTSGAPCMYDEYGDALLDNSYRNNGFFGNPTNGDLGYVNTEAGPTDCFAGNTDADGDFTSAPASVEQSYPTCNGQTVPPSDSNPQSAQFLDEVACDSQINFNGLVPVPCSPTDNYPRMTQINNGLHPLPPASQLPTMANACKGVPKNPWCTAKKAKRKKSKHRRTKHRHAA